MLDLYATVTNAPEVYDVGDLMLRILEVDGSDFEGEQISGLHP